ncbi:Deformed epidermal autoregulatory factor 1 -like protein [Caligus rogercresseyi]|uniref:Deformed epidermal autoregulatory factor 1 -like protein n=1 Tax=Caligus rogercresseyi TaxID=217165 RepID=A0A7T8GNX2_CALRO|nr:Deformed epidermal autoregulatory factor 1 -like protein [Caligus rogercresseyi]
MATAAPSAVSNESEIILRDDNVPPLSEELSRLYSQGFLTDITLSTEDGKNFEAHRVLLAARSHYFHSLVPRLKSEAVIFLKGVKGSILDKILKYIYGVPWGSGKSAGDPYDFEDEDQASDRKSAAWKTAKKQKKAEEEGDKSQPEEEDSSSQIVPGEEESSPKKDIILKKSSFSAKSVISVRCKGQVAELHIARFASGFVASAFVTKTPG